jgi:hypothetical protein
MRRLLGLAAIGVFAVALPAWAHHSHNAYEVTKWTEMEGTVTEIHYLLPHSWVYLEVKDAKGGEPTIWALEATGPQGIFRNGVTKEDVKWATRSRRAATCCVTDRPAVSWVS